MTEKIKKKPNKKSMSATIRDLRESLKRENDRNDRLCTRMLKAEYENEIIESYSAKLAIKKVKENKTHPLSFELINITLLA